jgi:guanyl-specific ribonuclease Sa
MVKTSRVFVLMMLVLTLVVLVSVAPRSSQGTTIIRSKSNTSNNRTASPIGEGPSGPSDTIVICESCKLSGMPEQAYLVLMDSQTGEMYAYSDDAVVGNAEPVFLGRLPAIGKRVLKTPYSPPK